MKNIDSTRKSILILMVIHIILYVLAYFTKLNFIGVVTKPIEILAPVVFTLVMLCYSFYLDNTYYGLISMTIAMTLNIFIYMVLGNSFYESINLAGAEFTLAIAGLVIILFISIFKTSKNKENEKLSEMFKEPKHVTLLYRAMMYCTVFSVFIYIYNNNSLNTASVGWLGVLTVLQAILPVFIMIGYITFTDVAYLLILTYSIVYGIITFLAFKYINPNLINVVNILEFAIVIEHLSRRYKEIKLLEKRKEV